jgi:hypothetical protein
LIGPLILVLIVTGFFWKLFTKQYTWMDHPDMAYLVLPWLQVQASSWHHEVFPLWDPHLWGGQPLLAQLQPGAAYPLNWLLFLLPLKDGHINLLFVQLNFVVTHVLAALFCYWLCRELRRSPAASILAGLAFALGGMVGSLGWPQMLNSAIWTPLVLLFYIRWLRTFRLREAVWSGTFLGIAFLSGHHNIPTFLGLTMACLWLVQIWKRGAWKPAAVFLVFTFLVSALQVLPGLEYGRRSVRFVGLPNAISWSQYVPYSVHEQYSLRPVEILGLILPDASTHDVFMGAALFTLALVGLVARFRSVQVRMVAAIAAGGLIGALGGDSIFHGVAYLIVPMVEKARSPAMALALVQFGVSVLAAYGLDALRVGTWKRWPTGFLTVAGILPWPVLMVLVSVRPQAGREYEHLAVFGMVALGLAVILRLWKSTRIGNALAVALIVGVALFELGTFTGRNYLSMENPTYLGLLQKNTDVVDFLRRQPDLVRLEVDLKTVPYNIGDWDGIDQYQAYLAGLTTNVLPFAGGGGISPSLFALTHYIGTEPVRPGMQEIFRGKSGINVYRNPEAFPRAWTVHQADVLARMDSAGLRSTVFLAGALPALESCNSQDEVRVTNREENRIELDARMACRGMVILSETFFPGWRATIDGREVEIYEADGTLRGVIVESGAHRIEMRYRPMSVYVGASLTALGLLAALLWRGPRGLQSRDSS